MAAIVFPKEKELRLKILQRTKSLTRDVREIFYPRVIKVVAGRTLDPDTIAVLLHAEFAKHTVGMERAKRYIIARHLRSVVIALITPDIDTLLVVQKKMNKLLRGLEKDRPYASGLT